MPPSLTPLPIDASLPEAIAALRAHGALVVVAPPGSGKTTRLPAAILDACPEREGRVILLQPRRVAARLAATRIAQERGGEVGGEIGYQVRFERRVSAATRLEILTEGLLTRRLQDDPFLEGVHTVILDELHERSLTLDLALALCAEVRREARPDLWLVVMSATMDPEPVARFLDAPILRAEGRAYPVTLRHDPRPDERPLHERVAGAIRAELPDEGHLLAFLPGVGEIQRVIETLGDLPDVEVLPLHSRLSLEQQARALAPSKGRKVVLATNIAETSVTFPGVRAVVDSGLERVMRYEPALGLERLELGPIAGSSADQRAGRAGRTGPGRCRRLWTEAEDRQRPAAQTPELQRADLSGLCLELRAWGADPRRLRWLDPPPAPAIERAEGLLRSLGALDDHGVTALGRDLSRLPLPPRVGATLLAGRRLGAPRAAAAVAALLTERDPFAQERHPDAADLGWRVEQVLGGGAGDRRALAAVRQVKDALLEALGGRLGPERPLTDPLLAELLLAGFPDRVARRRPGEGRRYLLVGGAGATLAEGQLPAELILAATMEAGRRGERVEHLIRVALPLEESWLPVTESRALDFDEARESVVSRRVWRFMDLTLREAPDPNPAEPVAAAAALLRAAQARPDRALTQDERLTTLLARVQLLAGVMPELDLPALAEPAALLPSLVEGRRSFAELRAVDLRDALLSQLTHTQRRALDEHAPERWTVPSGASVPVVYTPGEPPLLAARVQQLFGLRRTPHIAAGRVPVKVQLLSPGNRPVQTTLDLESFWTKTWPEVRKELRGRYPRHAWPEDPTNAIPEDRPKRRGT